MKTILKVLIITWVVASSCQTRRAEVAGTTDSLHYIIGKVKVADSFWSPKLQLFQTRTANDVYDKFEGKYTPEGQSLEKDFKVMGRTRNAFVNFDLVAEGKRGIGLHHGPPWYDGLIYETIRGSADLIFLQPDSTLEKRIDGYIDRIAKAQASDPGGYINTYTELMEPEHRWGFNGGLLRWQHDVYNAGMLVEAGVHYYRATGKTKLLQVAVRMANYMCNEIGPEPKKNVVPAHSGPEEAFLKLFQLFRHEPELKNKMDVPVDEMAYFNMVQFWIEARGHHVGLPTWNAWGNEKSEKWIRDVKYDDPALGEHRRPSWGDYAQDSVPVLQQKIIVGHAVRATLLATGVAAMAQENKDPRYTEAATSLWNNMVGRRMFITGGVGAIANNEKFGDDYFLPNDAYLETCAAVGSGFFSQRMNELTGDGKYIDEFERVLYNGVLTGISLSGDRYTYQNPLVSNHHQRWGWHDCPCCPPMFLKIMGALPDFIYSASSDGFRVNLFVGSETQVDVNQNQVHIKQTTNYPWDGHVEVQVDPEKEAAFTIKIRIPGWATGTENPFGLYLSKASEVPVLTVNGAPAGLTVSKGYVSLTRQWAKGDKIQLELPMKPRLVFANDKVRNLKDMAAIAAGPLVYCFENNLNKNFEKLQLDEAMQGEVRFQPEILNGVNTIEYQSASGSFKAVPYFAVGNLQSQDRYQVWTPIVHK